MKPFTVLLLAGFAYGWIGGIALDAADRVAVSRCAFVPERSTLTTLLWPVLATASLLAENEC